MTKPDPFESYRRRPRKARMSISLDTDLTTWVRAFAKQQKVPQSAVIELALRMSYDELMGQESKGGRR